MPPKAARGALTPEDKIHFLVICLKSMSERPDMNAVAKEMNIKPGAARERLAALIGRVGNRNSSNGGASKTTTGKRGASSAVPAKPRGQKKTKVSAEKAVPRDAEDQVNEGYGKDEADASEGLEEVEIKTETDDGQDGFA